MEQGEEKRNEDVKKYRMFSKKVLEIRKKKMERMVEWRDKERNKWIKKIELEEKRDTLEEYNY